MNKSSKHMISGLSCTNKKYSSNTEQLIPNQEQDKCENLKVKSVLVENALSNQVNQKPIACVRPLPQSDQQCKDCLKLFKSASLVKRHKKSLHCPVNRFSILSTKYKIQNEDLVLSKNTVETNNFIATQVNNVCSPENRNPENICSNIKNPLMKNKTNDIDVSRGDKVVISDKMGPIGTNIISPN